MFNPKTGDGEDLDDKSSSLDKAVQQVKGFGDKLIAAFEEQFQPEAILKAAIELDMAGTKIAHSFGQGRENMAVIKGSLTDAARDVAKLGGSFDDIVDAQTALSTQLGRNIMLQSDMYDDLYAAEKVTGQKMSEINDGFKEAGYSANQAAQGIQGVVDTARSMGVSVIAVTDKVMENIDALHKYNFQGGVDGLAKMAAHATALRIDMKNTLNFAEKVFEPEGAIEVAAAMQRLGVAQSDLLDPLRLMDLSANDPAELQRQMADMASQFVQLNEKGRFEIMPGAKRQLREIESSMGLAQGSLSKMALGAAELDDKLNKIRFPDFATDEQKEMIANLTEMNDQGEYIIKTEKGDQKLDEVMAQFAGDQQAFNDFLKQSQPKTLEEIAKEQLDYDKSMAADLAAIRAGKYGFAGSAVMDQVLEAPRRLQESASTILTPEALDPKAMRDFFDKNSDAILESVNKLVKGEGSLEDVLTAARNAIGDTKTLISEGLNQSINEVKTQFSELSKDSNVFLQIMTSGVDRMTGGVLNTTASDKNTVETEIEDQDMKSVSESRTYTEEKKTNEITVNLNLTGQGDMGNWVDNPANSQHIYKMIEDQITSYGMIGEGTKLNANIQIKR